MKTARPLRPGSPEQDLEGERQSIAAQCAYAVRDSPRQIEAALERSRERCEERDGFRPVG
jgi:hypothetical protein